jgi:hypothetical protein
MKTFALCYVLASRTSKLAMAPLKDQVTERRWLWQAVAGMGSVTGREKVPWAGTAACGLVPSG